MMNNNGTNDTGTASSNDNDAKEPLLRYTNLGDMAPLEDSLISPSRNGRGSTDQVSQAVATDTKVEGELSRLQLKILGEPYAATWRFWLQRLPLSIMVGVLVGSCTIIFLGSIYCVMNLWFVQPQDTASLMMDGFHGKRILIALGGTILSALVLLIPGAPALGTTRTMFHDVVDLKGHPRDTVFLVCSCWFCLVGGAPLGPEMAIGAMGSAIGTILYRKLVTPCSSNNRMEVAKTHATLVSCGLVASLGGLFPSPLLGVIIVHELAVAGRPQHGTSLNTFVLASHREENAYDEESSSQSPHPQEERDHDFMEQMTLTGTAATMAYVTVRLSVSWSSFHTFYGGHFDIVLSNHDFQLRHLAMAIPLGLLCGVLGSLVLIVNGLCRSIRQAVTARRPFVGRTGLPILAGLLFGLTSASNPLLVGTGMQWIQPLVQQHIDDVSGVPAHVLVQTALIKSLSMSVCLGFGLVGGPVFPLVFVGLCLGLAFASAGVVPLAVAVPCCMCAVAGSFVVIPITLVVFISMLFSLSPEQMGPPFVATFCSYTVLGGLGVVKGLGLRRLNKAHGNNNVEEGNDYFVDQGEDASLNHDDDLLRSVRKSIFGSP